jgi:hypothetical protein
VGNGDNERQPGSNNFLSGGNNGLPEKKERPQYTLSDPDADEFLSDSMESLDLNDPIYKSDQHVQVIL